MQVLAARVKMGTSSLQEALPVTTIAILMTIHHHVLVHSIKRSLVEVGMIFVSSVSQPVVLTVVIVKDHF